MNYLSLLNQNNYFLTLFYGVAINREIRNKELIIRLAYNHLITTANRHQNYFP